MNIRLLLVLLLLAFQGVTIPASVTITRQPEKTNVPIGIETYIGV
jgi:hypothetical protein